ncbi:hypothetical protein [Brucella intermedia]|uniref:hypothetical protein n=1 Tax=Brucella intermedia TaxID=94625 RepID=UPI00235E3807|nr:hypothetical protein [Brucella intermedia]
MFGSFWRQCRNEEPSFEMSADQMNRVSKTTTQLKGNAVIRLGGTEIRTEKAKIVVNTDKVTVFTDTFVAKGKK